MAGGWGRGRGGVEPSLHRGQLLFFGLRPLGRGGGLGGRVGGGVGGGGGWQVGAGVEPERVAAEPKRVRPRK